MMINTRINNKTPIAQQNSAICRFVFLTASLANNVFSAIKFNSEVSNLSKMARIFLEIMRSSAINDNSFLTCTRLI